MGLFLAFKNVDINKNLVAISYYIEIPLIFRVEIILNLNFFLHLEQDYTITGQERKLTCMLGGKEEKQCIYTMLMLPYIYHIHTNIFSLFFQYEIKLKITLTNSTKNQNSPV